MPLHITASLQAAAARTDTAPHQFPALRTEDLRQAVLSQKRQRLFVFVVDTSDSMADGTTASRIAMAKGAVLSLLNRAYISRDRVCLVTFGDDRADLVLPPTGSIDMARKKLQALPVGGSSPMARGLLESWKVIKRTRQKDGATKPLLILLSDGAVNAPISRSAEPQEEVIALAGRMSADGVPALVIDTGASQPGGLMTKLAESFGTTCRGIEQLRRRTIIETMDRAE